MPCAGGWVEGIACVQGAAIVEAPHLPRCEPPNYPESCLAGHGDQPAIGPILPLHLHDTPSNFYLGLRLEKARLLLRQSDLSVLEVSIASGFESPSYFTRS